MARIDALPQARWLRWRRAFVAMVGMSFLLVQPAFGVKQEWGLGGSAGFSRERQNQSRNHVTGAARIHVDLGTIFRASAEGKYFFRNQGGSILQSKLMVTLLFGRGGVQPYFGPSGTFNWLKLIGYPTQNKLGVGGHLGVGFRVHPDLLLLIEGQYDFILTRPTRTHLFGGTGGLMFQF